MAHSALGFHWKESAIEVEGAVGVKAHMGIMEEALEARVSEFSDSNRCAGLVEFKKLKSCSDEVERRDGPHSIGKEYSVPWHVQTSFRRLQLKSHNAATFRTLVYQSTH